MGAPPRASLVALATAMQESTLHNLDYGDRDSLGLFQQRPSQGWGTPAQVTDPVHATTIFLQRLLAVPGWETMPVTVAAQTVQRSAFPQAYAKWEGLAAELVTQLGQVARSPPARARRARSGRGRHRDQLRARRGRQALPVGRHRPRGLRLLGADAQGVPAAGVTISRVAADQYKNGGHVPVRQAQPGDLLFYATDPSDPATIHHVTLYMGNDQMVEAPYTGANVRVQPVPWNYAELVPLATRPGTALNRA